MSHSGIDHSMHHHDHHPSSEPISDPSSALTGSIVSGASCTHQGHGMSMTFHGGYNETILFEQWNICTPSGLIASVIGIFFLAALYEGLKYYRECLFWKTYNQLHYRSIPGQHRGGSTEENKDTTKVMPVCEVLQKQPASTLMLSLPHFFQTLLHILQISVSFLLMLIFMTYNSWLCIAVVLGSGCGYFLFGWKKSLIVDVTSEHCH